MDGGAAEGTELGKRKILTSGGGQHKKRERRTQPGMEGMRNKKWCVMRRENKQCRCVYGGSEDADGSRGGYERGKKSK